MYTASNRRESPSGSVGDVSGREGWAGANTRCDDPWACHTTQAGRLAENMMVAAGFA